ncbi:uncharacterized protein B0I36DRAFT_364102 [Microdochium trichocladiopsis]|uniref:Phosphatidylethanolamine-binding protein n=1 Tax=Microdochium trichocladiopsis TaxID=1682393 RepID=A0A9P8Y4T4_9PEZI|nr:uncharacterized protein B0I36DRAFT_364102 [Microdochium trichocladiopsis]KAH7029582.1 hypothetical protein B0I36DRAFT_364102 [Microdochium trichocladiopsis]
MKLTTRTAILWYTTIATATISALPHHTPRDDFDWAMYHCSPDDPLATLPTPTYGAENRSWMMCAELTIYAPPSFVYYALIDYNSYHLWNTFVTSVFNLPPNVTTTPNDVYVGMPMNFVVAGMNGDDDPTVGESQEIVTVLRAPPSPPTGGDDNDDDDAPHYRYLMNAWRSDSYVEGEFVVAEHPNILTPVEGDEDGEEWTRYVSYETYYEGAISDYIRSYQPRLQVLFDRQGGELKAYVEGLWQARRRGMTEE